MSTLQHFPSIFQRNAIFLLKQKSIVTALDFLRETPENIGKILELPFKKVLEIRDELTHALSNKPSTTLDLFERIHANYFILSTGIPEIDLLIDGLESGRIYEICGFSGSGKSQICLSIAAHVSSLDKSVVYIDSKNDFSAARVLEILKKKKNKDIAIVMERIKVIRVFSLHQLVDVLHRLQNLTESRPISLVVVDCISTCYYAYMGGDRPFGYAMLNHVASVMKYIVSQHHCIFVFTNLATKAFSAADNRNSSENSMKPSLGSYWQQISNIRLDLRKKDSCTVAVSVGKSDDNINYTIRCINLSSV